MEADKDEIGYLALCLCEAVLKKSDIPVTTLGLQSSRNLKRIWRLVSPLLTTEEIFWLKTQLQG